MVFGEPQLYSPNSKPVSATFRGFQARHAFSLVGREISWKCISNPWVEVEPHVFTYEFSGFSDWQEAFVDRRVEGGGPPSRSSNCFESHGNGIIKITISLADDSKSFDCRRTTSSGAAGSRLPRWQPTRRHSNPLSRRGKDAVPDGWINRAYIFPVRAIRSGQQLVKLEPRGQHPQRLFHQAVNLRLRNFSPWVNSPENGDCLPFSKTVFGSVFLSGSQILS
jgi:hypothetical protein